MSGLLLAGIPNPVEVVIDATSDVAGAVTGSVFDGFGSFVVSWLADACRDIGWELVSLLSGPAQVDFTRGWWAGPGGRELAGDIGALALALTIAFLLLAVLQGLLAGDPGGMLRTAMTQLPLSVLGMVCVVGGAELLLGVTDEASHLVLGDAPANLGRFVDGITTVAGLPGGSLAVALLLVVFLIGALLVWAELVVRAALVYLLVAFAPLVLAARIWPAARGLFRRLVELGIAVIVSKFVIAVALALGAAALAGEGPEGGGEGGTLTLAGLLGGATLMSLAAFTPFVVLRLLPGIEHAAVAHGITSSPVRGAQSAVAAGTLPSRVSGIVAGGKISGVAAAGAAPPLPVAPSGSAGPAGASASRNVERRTAGSAPGRQGRADSGGRAGLTAETGPPPRGATLPPLPSRSATDKRAHPSDRPSPEAGPRPPKGTQP